MKENIASFVCASSEKEKEEARKVKGKIVDFPGHPSLRGSVLFHYSHPVDSWTSTSLKRLPLCLWWMERIMT